MENSVNPVSFALNRSMTQAVLQPQGAEQIRVEYDAIRSGVGVLDVSSAGKLQLSGKNWPSGAVSLFRTGADTLRIG